MIPPTIRSFASIGCLLLLVSSLSAGELDELVSIGLPIGANGNRVKLPAPSMADGLTGEQQDQIIDQIADKAGRERFLKKAIVSPFTHQWATDPQNPDVRTADIWFVAYGTLDTIADKNLFKDFSVSVAEKSIELPVESRQLGDDEISRRTALSDRLYDKDTISYGLLSTAILDKVYLTGLSYSRVHRSSESILIQAWMDPLLLEDPEFPARWSPLVKDKRGKVTMGPAVPYPGLGAYAKATKLQNFPGALFVEVHFAYVEPEAWFQGRKLLVAKFPLLFQDSVREFRGKLGS